MHITLVADNPVEAARIAGWLCEGLGPDCVVDHIDNLNEALVQMQAHVREIDVLIVDLIIPPSAVQMAGLRIAQERAPGMAIIVVSDLADDDVVRTAIRSGAQEFVVKASLDAHRLAAIVRAAVTERQRWSERLQAAEAQKAPPKFAVVLCELSPRAIELLARQAIARGLSTQETLDQLICESFAPKAMPLGEDQPSAP